MITAIVLIDAEANRIPEVAKEAAELEGISEVFSVTGDIDLIAIARVSAHEELAGVVADRLSKIDGVINTRTYIAFQTYSKGDLEEAFSLGLGD
ncbi:AsnC family transcriptional regulator [Bowdeniella nasicola]|uniref:AsnC family transcriptional regulator n=1 Tax=Bowdeniella nasicola TaxID=208480 RepID=A0A1Q5PZH9_9ACTO|nr:Lrp/AsnC ligand binding domain-containing protein [Bowdeniella nasicola]OKL53024.1 AsnC family transcriptional regulator [Bowdeniella nasicola]